MADYSLQFTGPEADARLAMVTSKQDMLVSSGANQNIKTINGQSVLGAGDIVAGNVFLGPVVETI